MLSKLMKHEFRATKRTMVPAILILLAASVGARFSLMSFMNTQNEALLLLGTLMTMAYVIVTFGLLIACAVLMVVRFYKNLMGDEGYLMFTLPVSIHHQIWSKLLTSTLWMVLCGITIVVSAFLLIVGYAIDFDPVITVMRRLLQPLFQVHQMTLLILTILCGILSIMAGFAEVYAAISVGCSRPNAKILWSFLIFFAFRFAMSFLSGLLPQDTQLSVLATGTDGDPIAAYLFDLVGQGGKLLLFYFITVYFTRNKLNLE